MRAVRLHRAGETLRDESVADPSPAAGEILIEIRAAGICHSDAHYRKDPGRAKLPVTPGHEIPGVIAARGTRVDGFSEGDRVALHYLVRCRACSDCSNGPERFCSKTEMLGNDRDGGYSDPIYVSA